MESYDWRIKNTITYQFYSVRGYIVWSVTYKFACLKFQTCHITDVYIRSVWLLKLNRYPDKDTSPPPPPPPPPHTHTHTHTQITIYVSRTLTHYTCTQLLWWLYHPGWFQPYSSGMFRWYWYNHLFVHSSPRSRSEWSLFPIGMIKPDPA